MPKISCFIIAKNEAARIKHAVLSVKGFADEVIVIDSGSTDETVKICTDLGARVVYNEWPGYVKQKAFGEKLCKHDWVFNIDADEEVSPELQNEIVNLVNNKKIFPNNNEHKYLAFNLTIVILHNHDIKPRFLAPTNQFIRLYNRQFCSFSNVQESTTHDAVLFNSDVIAPQTKTYNCHEVLYHRPNLSVTQLVGKLNFYSSEQARDLINSGRKIPLMRIFFEMPLSFLKAFFIRRYFVFGFDGFIYSMVFAFGKFMRLAKVFEFKEK